MKSICLLQNNIWRMLGELDYSPLIVSLKTGVVATIVCFFLGVYAAVKSMNMSRVPKAVLDGILTLPMVLPPTASGFILLLIFGRNRAAGSFLYEELGIKVVQTWLGCIVAAVVISFPLMYKNARAAFEQVDVSIINAGKTLGMSDFKIFWRVVLPTAGPGVVSGTILTFARSIGEYGATSMIAGNIPGKTGTVSQKIAMVLQNGDYVTAGLWTAVILIISLVIIVAVNVCLTEHRTKR